MSSIMRWPSTTQVNPLNIRNIGWSTVGWSTVRGVSYRYSWSLGTARSSKRYKRSRNYHPSIELGVRLCLKKIM